MAQRINEDSIQIQKMQVELRDNNKKVNELCNDLKAAQ
jgi:hypothetical protein